MSIVNYFLKRDIVIFINSCFRYARQPRALLQEIPFKEIIYYLNEITNKKFQYTNPTTKRDIANRWNEGYRLDDFKKVIDVKTVEWIGTEFAKYLRPQTLFGKKFDSYVNQEQEGVSTCSNPECQQVLDGTEINCPKCHWRLR